MGTRIPTSSAWASTPAPAPRKRPLWPLLLPGILLAILLASGIYWLTHPSIAGEWYGPGNFAGNASSTLPLGMYLKLSQDLRNDLTGTGQICVHRQSGIIQIDLDVTGHISGTDIALDISAPGLAADGSAGTADLPLPIQMKMNGVLANDSIALTSTTPQGVLTLTHGSHAGYLDTCNGLPTAA